MIKEYNVMKFCKDDISKIENYNEALADNEITWDCHHKLEIHEDYNNSKADLIMMNLYYNRPACELIFLPRSEHRRIHNKGNKFAKGNKSKSGKKGEHYKMVNSHKGMTWKIVNGKRLWCK